MNERFAPLAELHEHPGNVSIDWQLPLPEYSGADSLVLDVKSANRIAHLGALWEVTIRPGRRQEEDQPVVGGMTDDGTASAAATLGLIKRKLRPDVNLDDIYDDGGLVPFWKTATIGVDIDSISDRLSRERTLREPQAWANQLNRVVLGGLRQAAVRNVHEYSQDTGSASMAGIAGGAAVGTTLTAFVIEDFPPNLVVPFALIQAAMMVPFMSLLGLYEHVKKGYKADLKPDMIPLHLLPYGIDRRARIAATAMRHTKLIQYMPEATD